MYQANNEISQGKGLLQNVARLFISHNPLKKMGTNAASQHTDFSAGGLLVDLSTSRVVCICPTSQHGVVGLPKGHPEPGETAQQAALREVREETGFIPRLVQPEASASIQYSFVRREKTVVKTVQYFLMYITGGSSLDHDHEVTEVLLLDRNEALRRLTFEDERNVVRKLFNTSPRRPSFPISKGNLAYAGIFLCLASILMFRCCDKN